MQTHGQCAAIEQNLKHDEILIACPFSPRLEFNIQYMCILGKLWVQKDLKTYQKKSSRHWQKPGKYPR